MDTSEKLKALHEHCNRHKTCQPCILNNECCLKFIDGECCLKFIDGEITGMYEDIKTRQNAAAPTEDMPTEDGTAAGAAHYLACPIQPIELMQYTLTHEELLGFLKGNIIKYTLRANHKGTPEKDKAKALQYKKWLDVVLIGDTINV